MSCQVSQSNDTAQLVVLHNHELAAARGQDYFQKLRGRKIRRHHGTLLQADENIFHPRAAPMLTVNTVEHGSVHVPQQNAVFNHRNKADIVAQHREIDKVRKGRVGVNRDWIGGHDGAHRFAGKHRARHLCIGTHPSCDEHKPSDHQVPKS